VSSSEQTEAAMRKARGALLELAVHSPFFGTLALFAGLVAAPERTQTAATDGRTIFYCPEYVNQLSRKQLRGLLLHEVLHAALLHPSRRGLREPLRWNLAADIVTNGIVRALNWAELPQGAIIEAALETFSVEEVYELVAVTPQTKALLNPDLLESEGPQVNASRAETEAYWRQARAQAEVLSAHGSKPVGLVRELGKLADAKVDWRTELWRFAAKTPDDFADFDRRFIHRGLYLESLAAETLELRLALDTSGSISIPLLHSFVSEVRAILGLYPRVRGELYFADAALYGPYDLEQPIPTALGRGGTSFVPFFEAIERDSSLGASRVAIYLTDGFGEFPRFVPTLPVLWAVAPGGARDETFPFGRVIRMVD
jgi:predicted metal-dependent peptidase